MSYDSDVGESVIVRTNIKPSYTSSYILELACGYFYTFFILYIIMPFVVCVCVCQMLLTLPSVVSATSGRGEPDWDKIIKLCNRIRDSIGTLS